MFGGFYIEVGGQDVVVFFCYLWYFVVFKFVILFVLVEYIVDYGKLVIFVFFWWIVGNYVGVDVKNIVVISCDFYC